MHAYPHAHPPTPTLPRLPSHANTRHDGSAAAALDGRTVFGSKGVCVTEENFRIRCDHRKASDVIHNFFLREKRKSKGRNKLRLRLHLLLCLCLSLISLPVLIHSLSLLSLSRFSPILSSFPSLPLPPFTLAHLVRSTHAGGPCALDGHADLCATPACGEARDAAVVGELGGVR